MTEFSKQRSDRRGHADSEETPRKPFYIQRRRLGTIRHMQPDGQFGFIDAEDFREDVFFHRSMWEGPEGSEPSVRQFVEFELDDEHRAAEQRLRATVVRPTDRPQGKRLSAEDAPHLAIRHHPKARRKRPSWRGSGKEE